MEEYFYHTNAENRLINLYVRDHKREEQVLAEHKLVLKQKRAAMELDRSAKTFYKNCVFYPSEWEKLNSKQIKSARGRYTRKFLLWSLTNKATIQQNSESEWRMISRSQSSFGWTCVFSLLSGMFANRFVKRVDPPPLIASLLGPMANDARLRKALLGCLTLSYVFHHLVLLVNNDLLFDTGLKYKEQVAPGTLTDGQCDIFLKEFTQRK